jgi:hypothetical protein
MNLLRRSANLLWAALQEIFEESAYQRFLQRNNLATSREAYAAFVREQEFSKARRPRCC